MAACKVLFAVSFALTTLLGSCNTMNCGAGVPLCGTLTLQTGLGNGVYHASTPLVHGLWPEVGSYGTSKCIKPQNPTAAVKVYDCYNTPDSSHTHALSFENHEWKKHGSCAGVKDVNDFFGQVCALSKAPVADLAAARTSGPDQFDALAKMMKAKGYPVWALDQMNKQVELSVCAGNDGRWMLSTVADMPSKCGGGSPGPAPGPPAPPSPAPPAPAPPAPAHGSCKAGQKGPKCSKDGDCTSCDGCVRCAGSGYCTSQPLSQSAPIVVV